MTGSIQGITGQAAHGAARGDLAALVNGLAQELAQAQRALGAAQQKLGSTTRSLEARTQELAEARAALALLLATLDSTTSGVLALGYFGRAMHYNTRFIEMWGIAQDKLASLNEQALLALQLAQVRDPVRFLAEAEARKARPDDEHFSTVELTDGRIFECHAVPQRVRGKRVGLVTSFQDITQRERLERIVSALESEMPAQVAEVKATIW